MSSLLAIAFCSGVGMLFIRFGSERPSPPWLAKLHGFAAAGAITLLAFGCAHLAVPGSATLALLTLLVAAGAGLALNLGYHWRQRPLPEWLVFAHLAVASLGFLVAGVVTLSLAA